MLFVLKYIPGTTDQVHEFFDCYFRKWTLPQLLSGEKVSVKIYRSPFILKLPATTVGFMNLGSGKRKSKTLPASRCSKSIFLKNQ
jgi:hypothetical protein